LDQVKITRLASAAKELNVHISTIVDHLHAKGFKDVASTPNTKLTEEQYDILLRDFRSNIVNKEKAEQINIGKSKEEEELKIKEALNEKPKIAVKEEEKITVVKHEAERPKIIGKIDLEKPKRNIEEGKIIRLATAAKEFNVGISKLLVILNANGFNDIINKPNTKLTEEQYSILSNSLKEDVNRKEWLSGPKILGKIELPIKQERSLKDILSEAEMVKREEERRKLKMSKNASKDNKSTINSWKAFIKAQEVFVNQYSEPFTIVFKKTDKEGLTHFEITQTDPLLNIFHSLLKSFPGISKEDINIKDGYLLYDSSSTPQHTNELKEIADANYFEFDYKPCFSGHVSLKENPFKWLVDINGKQPNKEGKIDATLSDIKHIDEKIHNLSGFSRSALIGGIFKVQPSKYYFNKEYNLINSFLYDKLGIESVDSQGHFFDLIIENVFLNEAELNYIKENSAYKKSHHRLIYTIDKEKFDLFEKIRQSKGIFYTREENKINETIKFLDAEILKISADKRANPKLMDTGISKLYDKRKKEIQVNERINTVLPDAYGSEFHLTFPSSISLLDLQYEIFHYKKVFERYFGPDSFTIKHQHIFQIDRNLFFEHFQNSIQDERFNVSVDKETISFDFINEDELKAGIEYLSALQIADIDNKGAEHGFKIKLQYESPLLSIQLKLQEIPAIKTKMSDNGLKLSFFCFFDNHDLLKLLEAKIKDAIDPLLNDNMQYTFEELQKGKLKYFLNFKQEEFEAEVNSKFNYLRGEEISIWDEKKPIAFGSILKMNYPNIVIEMESMKEDICIPAISTKVCCTLKGERDKIKRLSNTIDIIFSISKQKILNENLRDILMDSSKAESIHDDILRTAEYEKSINEIDSSLLSKNINERQKEAIAKCLLAKDFFLIQGPPGTGKSTAIAELIWQHIRSNISVKKEPYRILVTSETNLAVDNALDKLRSKKHLLIKPIRFGSDDKLDKEGRRFSLESLKQWVIFGNKELTEDKSATNILQDWITLISDRARSKRTNVSSEISEKWLTYLSNSNEHLRSLFFNNYTQNANVIGATCSSIGKENSEQKFTRFFSDYCNVVHTKEYDAFRLSINKNTIAALKKRNIEFDLVVQDEASKASPPELALPCLYGKKAVVIGDHRQLPPMVDTNEFIDNLKMMSKKTKDENNRNEINELIRYIKTNKEEFSISHFEKLFIAIDENLKSSFNKQYRMHPAINETIKQFYMEDGGLECGIPDEIANSEDMSHPLNRYHGVTSNKKTHVIWLVVNSPEIKSGTSRVNYGEVQAVDWLLSYFKKSQGYKNFVDYWPAGDIEQKQIGIITFYGAQAGLLNKLKDKYPDVPLRISPVDRFQGMERNIVIVSLVRSDCIAEFPNQAPDMDAYTEKGYPNQESLGFAEFPNRLNVALSRAKRLLIIVGNSNHFRKHPIYNKVYETIQQHPNGAIKTFDAKTLKQ
jgi:superfamily I DNA and/or RNA helicase